MTGSSHQKAILTILSHYIVTSTHFESMIDTMEASTDIEAASPENLALRQRVANVPDLAR